MSINGINGTSGAARIPSSAADTAATSGAARTAAAGTASAEVKQEEGESPQSPVRFPWLSRLSASLEAASNHRARFSTQILGDHVDRKA